MNWEITNFELHKKDRTNYYFTVTVKRKNFWGTVKVRIIPGFASIDPRFKEVKLSETGRDFYWEFDSYMESAIISLCQNPEQGAKIKEKNDKLTEFENNIDRH